MIRPRVRSYGDSSTVTLSPGRILMKCIRIFPEMCARTRWPFSSSTRNIALGRGSTTVPSTWTPSSFATLPPAPPLHRSRAPREDLGSLQSNGHRVLEMRAARAVARGDRPAVAAREDVGRAQIHHRLDRQD